MYKNIYNYNNIIKLDAPTPWGLFFQDSATPQMEGIEELHNNIMFYLAIILFTVTWIMITTIKSFESKKSLISHKYMNHGMYVPIQKCYKFKNNFLKKKIYIPICTYTTSSSKPLDNNYTNYIKVYENAFDMRKDIIKENKGKSGIFMSTNKITNEKYIEKSIDISKRFQNYFTISYIKSKDKGKIRISRAFINYGYSNFSVTILEYCAIFNLRNREQHWIDKFKPQYNILKMSAISGNLINIYEKCYGGEYKLIGGFVSARRAGKFLGISGSTVIRYMNSGEVFKDRYKFSSK